MKNHKPEYRYVLTNTDYERIERLISLLADTIYELFRARELDGNVTITEEPSLHETMFNDERYDLKNSLLDLF
jgi:hypothetical protein